MARTTLSENLSLNSVNYTKKSFKSPNRANSPIPKKYVHKHYSEHLSAEDTETTPEFFQRTKRIFSNISASSSA